MTKSLTFVALAALMLAIVGCVGNQPQQKPGDAVVAPSSSSDSSSHLMVPIRFME